MPETPEEIAAETAAAEQAATAAAASNAAHLTEHGFPSETAVADMQPLEQAAYWRAETKKQQKKNEGVDVTKLQADAAELAALKAAGMNDHEKALADAREEARREGENIGSEKYLKQAVTAKFQLLTGKNDEEVETALDVVDLKKFLDDKGEILADKLQAFAATFGQKVDDGGKPGSRPNPVRDALAGQQRAGGTGGGAGSIAEMKAQRLEKYAEKTTKK